jgi:hypothetical protein
VRTLDYARGCRLGKLYDEITAAVPSLRPTGAGIDRVATVTLTGTATTTELGVPDATSAAVETQLAALVAAHDATTPGAGEQAQANREANEAAWRADLLALLVKIEAGTVTAAEQRRALARVVRIVLRQLD